MCSSARALDHRRRQTGGALKVKAHAHLSPHSLADNAGVAAELADEARELEQRVEPVEDAHVAEADLLDEVELELLVHRLELDDTCV